MRAISATSFYSELDLSAIYQTGVNQFLKKLVNWIV